MNALSCAAQTRQCHIHMDFTHRQYTRYSPRVAQVCIHSVGLVRYRCCYVIETFRIVMRNIQCDELCAC